MSKRKKIWLILATVLTLVGILLFGVTMTILKWDFQKLTTAKFNTVTHEIKEVYRDISVITDTSDLVFLPSPDNKTSVVCYEDEKIYHLVTVKEGKLSINIRDTRKWYDYIGIHFETPKITVYLPAGEYGKLEIQLETGEVQLAKEFQFQSLGITASTGDVTNCASVLEEMKIQTSTGRIAVENASASTLRLSTSTGKIIVKQVDCTEDVTIHVTTGKTNLIDLKCKNLTSTGSTGDILLENVIAAEKISVKRSTGDVDFERSDASEILVETSTGDVEGSLRSEKIFFAETDTGEKDVPKTLTGGRCEIKTSTGDIEIVIQN